MDHDSDPWDGDRRSPLTTARAIPLAGVLVGAAIAWFFGANFVVGVAVGAAVGLGAYRFVERRRVR